eukprot:56546-Chlamydomonas_euryale.AAC.1
MGAGKGQRELRSASQRPGREAAAGHARALPRATASGPPPRRRRASAGGRVELAVRACSGGRPLQASVGCACASGKGVSKGAKS